MFTDIVRLGDQMWAFPNPAGDEELGYVGDRKIEVRMHASGLREACIGYQAAHQLGVKTLIDQDVMVSIEGIEGLTWKITPQEHRNCLKERLGGIIQMLYKIKPEHYICFDVKPTKVKTGCCIPGSRDELITLDLERSDLPDALSSVKQATLSRKLVDLLNREAFSDPHTELSTRAFQLWESEFTTRKDFRPSCQIRLDGKELVLEPIPNSAPNARQRQANRATVAHYLEFLDHEYGADLLPAIEHRYEINFKEMFEHGDPLTPEHIYRVNVGLNNIEIQEVEGLFSRLKPMLEELEALNVPEQPLDNFFLWYDLASTLENQLSVREMRGIKRVIRESVGRDDLRNLDLQNFLQNLFSNCRNSRTCNLSMAQFDSLVRCLWTPEASWDRIFTGRKIVHRAIMGFYTTADKVHFKPWLDQHELLQILPQCTDTEDWNNFYERLVHVVCKKHMVRQHPDDIWRVGAVIPAPRTLDEENRWYVISSCIDDHQGDFNYTLEPATSDTNMPAIKLYRSTASSKYAMSNWTSVESDLNPSAAPGGHNRWSGDLHELPFIKERSIPVWVGYYLKGKSYQKLADGMKPQGNGDKLAAQFESWRQCALDSRAAMEAFQKAVEEMCEIQVRQLSHPSELPQDQKARAKELEIKRKRELATWKSVYKSFQKKKRVLPAVPVDPTAKNLAIIKKQVADYKAWIPEFKKILSCHAHDQKELPQYKIDTDIAWAGHSLGGSLSQGGCYHFTVHHGRIPLPGRQFICYAGDAPCLNPGENEAFLEFGEKHRFLFRFFDQHWRIIHQFERGDIIPMGGHTHLGSVEGSASTWRDWMSLTINIFRPLDNASALEVYDPPTHGRRIGQAEEYFDYTQTPLTPSDLYAFDSAWFLTPSEQELWGYAPWISPKIVEGTRRTLGTLAKPIRHLNKRYLRRIWPERGDEIRDQNWHFYCQLNQDGSIHLE